MSAALAWRRVSGAVLALWLGVGGLPQLAHAQEDDSFDLSWDAPPECPSEARMREEVERLIGPGAHEGGAQRVSVQIAGGETNGYRVRLRFEEAERVSERTLRGPTCNQVSRAAALLVALAIEPNAKIDEEPEPEPEPKPKPQPKPTPPPPEPEPVPLPPAPRKQPHRFALALGPAIEAGLLPALSPGAELSFGARFGSVEPELYASGFLPRSKDIANTSAGGRFTLLTFGARLCLRLFDEGIVFGGCLGGALNHLSAEGYKVTVPGSADTTIGSLEAQARLELPLSRRVALRLAGGPVYSLGRAEFVVDGLGSVHEAERLSGTGSLKLTLRF